MNALVSAALSPLQRQHSYFTNITFSDPSGEWEPRVIAALQHAVVVCGGRREIF